MSVKACLVALSHRYETQLFTESSLEQVARRVGAGGWFLQGSFMVRHTVVGLHDVIMETS